MFQLFVYFVQVSKIGHVSWFPVLILEEVKRAKSGKRLLHKNGPDLRGIRTKYIYGWRDNRSRLIRWIGLHPACSISLRIDFNEKKRLSLSNSRLYTSSGLHVFLHVTGITTRCFNRSKGGIAVRPCCTSFSHIYTINMEMANVVPVVEMLAGSTLGTILWHLRMLEIARERRGSSQFR